MKQVYVIYLSIRDDGNVIFSSPYSSFNKAKDNIELFLKEYSEERGKKAVNISKDDLKKLKINKKPDDCLYVRRKISEATIYSRTTLSGTFYDGYLIEKYGKIGINEFSIPFKEEKIKKKEKKEEKGKGEEGEAEAEGEGEGEEKEKEEGEKEAEEIKKETERSDGIEKMSHGFHVSFITELKTAFSKRNKNVDFEKMEEIRRNEIRQNPFLISIINGKKTLRNLKPDTSLMNIDDLINDVNSK